MAAPTVVHRLSDVFEGSLRKSKQPFIAAIIAEESVALDVAAGPSSVNKSAAPGKMAPPPTLPGSSGFSSVGKSFLNDLRKLMRELQKTQPHFVRCLKPNAKLERHTVDGSMSARFL